MVLREVLTRFVTHYLSTITNKVLIEESPDIAEIRSISLLKKMNLLIILKHAEDIMMLYGIRIISVQVL